MSTFWINFRIFDLPKINHTLIQHENVDYSLPDFISYYCHLFGKTLP